MHHKIYIWAVLSALDMHNLSLQSFAIKLHTNLFLKEREETLYVSMVFDVYLYVS